ncbi:MAG TPA: TonB-dependent receptor [Acidimicrobiales bacterium]|nr:TonB-dependent receptor [Acidimicrobiales bacterium]
MAPLTSITSHSIVAGGYSLLNPSGNQNPGTISINGQREYANSFVVNDADTMERFTTGAAVNPNLDSISEFRILTGNFNAEYGNYSGGRISVVTKSGTNAIHGSGFEFFRNTELDANDFLTAQRVTYQQNQIGGTLGGPMVRDKGFFFADYQYTGMKQGASSGLVSVPSQSNRDGNFSDVADSLSGAVSGPYWAQRLARQLGYTVWKDEPYYFPGCSISSCVFPDATIPKRVWSAPASNLLQYIPDPNLGRTSFLSSSQNSVLHDRKGAMRLDGISRWGMLSGYYFADDYSMNNPYPSTQGGATVPGFDALNAGLTQMVTLGAVKTLGSNVVNEFRLSFIRDVNEIGTPIGHTGITLTSQGFLNDQGQPSILPQRPGILGIENITFNSFTIGSTVTGLSQADNTFEWRDNVSLVLGRHDLRFGAELMYSQVNVAADIQSNGTFAFTGSETGSDFADFLLGIASQFRQGDARPFYSRNKYASLFAQDGWRINSRLTLNYGLRWDVIMPWYEKYNQIQTVMLGEQSLIYPNAPRGIVFPGDPGVARSIAPTRFGNFSPRMGVAFSPAAHSGLLGRLLGENEISIRAGYGRFFSAVEGVAIGVMAGDPPYGYTYVSPAPPLLSDPFINAIDGTNNGQRFPLHLVPLGASTSNPDGDVDWTEFEPIGGMPGYDPNNQTPYSEQYTLSIQRQFGKTDLLTLAYVGSQGHHLLDALPANAGNPSLCLKTPGCGPFQEDIYQTRQPFGPSFGDVTLMSTIGNSNYNALEITIRHTSDRFEVLAGYTFSKSMDNASSLSDQLKPNYPRATYAPSGFDLKHNLVASYNYRLPFEQLFRVKNRVATGWILSGITRFSTGFPVTLHNNSDRSLLGLQSNGVNNTWGVDTPQFTPGRLSLNSNPRNGKPYFNTSLFSLQPLGQTGNSKPRFFYGPGITNFDMTLEKDMQLTESKVLALRIDSFNLFNHPQYFGSDSVDGSITSGTFGQTVKAMSPRVLQIALKLSF